MIPWFSDLQMRIFSDIIVQYKSSLLPSHNAPLVLAVLEGHDISSSDSCWKDTLRFDFGWAS